MQVPAAAIWMVDMPPGCPLRHSQSEVGQACAPAVLIQKKLSFNQLINTICRRLGPGCWQA